jgi:hypothetical protein
MEQEKKYFADAIFFICPRQYCKKQVMQVLYFRAHSKAEVGAARREGLFSYFCPHCRNVIQSNEVHVNGEMNETSKEEALNNGLAWESAGSA